MRTKWDIQCTTNMGGRRIPYNFRNILGAMKRLRVEALKPSI